jgi:hypothetical protein
MSSRLAGRLSAARQSRFVGRASEQALFQSALAEAELPFQVLYVFGPSGVGTSTLLRVFAHHCEQSKTPVMQIDARNVEPAPEAFINALRLVMNLGPQDSPLDVMAAQSGHVVILIDSYEALAPLDDWIREKLLGELPENTLLVLAGRNPPSAAWRSDPAWQTLIRTIPLRNFSPQESRDYLTKRGVPPEQHRAVLDFTHGHPLALSLVADVYAQRGNYQFRPESAPDVVKALLEKFVQKVPGPAHRAALELCALVRLTTEALLAEVLKIADAHELFEWLRELSFIEPGSFGLFPHDLAREALVADLRWRNPDWYKELHNRARNYYAARVQQSHGLEQQRILYDYVFLHRDNPVIRSMLEWQTGGAMTVPDSMHDADRAALIAMVEKHEGVESAQFAAQWLARQPEGVTVYRDEKGDVVGFIAMVALQCASIEQVQSDPATRLACDYLQRHTPLRSGEVATHYRFWMAHDTYQDVSSVQTLIFLNTVRYQLTTSGLAYHFLPCANPEMWAGAFAYANLTRLTETDYKVGDKTYGVYGHDWRAEPPLAWLQMLAEREVATGPVAPPAPPPPLVVLSETEFANAVLDALRDFMHPNELRDNVLLHSRLVTDRAGTQAAPDKRIATLQLLLQEATDALQRSPREAKLYRALFHTYFQPAPTQEQAAELLDLPFSTFRRHLKAGITRVTDILWQKEIGSMA